MSYLQRWKQNTILQRSNLFPIDIFLNIVCLLLGIYSLHYSFYQENQSDIRQKANIKFYENSPGTYPINFMRKCIIKMCLTDSNSWLTLIMSMLLVETDVLQSDWVPLGSRKASSSVNASGGIAWKKIPVTKLVAKAKKVEKIINNFCLIKIWKSHLSKRRARNWRIHKQRSP